MAKKALISTTEPEGPNSEGYRVLEVVETGQEFDTHPSLEWKDCPDTVESHTCWYNPITNEYKLAPYGVPIPNDLIIQTNEAGYPLEKYVFNWDTATWSKESL